MDNQNTVDCGPFGKKANVLILVLMDNQNTKKNGKENASHSGVLILVLMDNQNTTWESIS